MRRDESDGLFDDSLADPRVVLDRQNPAVDLDDAKPPRNRHDYDLLPNLVRHSTFDTLRRVGSQQERKGRVARGRKLGRRRAAPPIGRTGCELTDDEYMALALLEAERAAQAGEVPVGAIVVVGGAVVGRGQNRPVASADPTAHAEIVALREACRSTGNYRLVGAELFVTVEPCLMCVGAILQARMTRVVYGCSDPKGGFLGTLGDFSGDSRLNHAFAVRRGVCGDAAATLLRDFFRGRR